ncbi:hypothetical protein GPALN_002134 [Globodera pallida]|nr:hypothetical protein GPALN_002134 [Globodera pallida]
MTGFNHPVHTVIGVSSNKISKMGFLLLSNFYSFQQKQLSFVSFSSLLSNPNLVIDSLTFTFSTFSSDFSVISGVSSATELSLSSASSCSKLGSSVFQLSGSSAGLRGCWQPSYEVMNTFFESPLNNQDPHAACPNGTIEFPCERLEFIR